MMRSAALGFIVLILVFAQTSRAGLLDQFRSWQSHMASETAVKNFESKKMAEAAVSARRAIQLDHNNKQAIDILAKLSAAVSPDNEVRWRQRLVELEPGSSDALLDLVQAAIDARQVDTGAKALAKIPENDRHLRFYRLAAGLSLVAGDQRQAAELYRQAATEKGAERADQFNVAALDLGAADSARSGAAEKALASLASDPELAVKCHRLLASHFITIKDFGSARPHIDYLLGVDQVDFQDVIMALDFFSFVDRTKFDQLLTNCFVRFQNEALPASQIVRWLNAKGFLAEAKTSPGKVTPRVTADPVFRAAYADTLTDLKDWNALQEWTTGHDWGPDEYLRIAYQLRARRELNNIMLSEFQLGWDQALARTQQQAECVSVLHSLATVWGWDAEAEKALWAGANGQTHQMDALRALWTMYQQKKNTRGLFRVANRMLELRSADKVIKNNVVMLGSLLGIDNNLFREWAKQNWEEDQGAHPEFATTYAYVLFQRGKIDDAAAVLSKMNADALNKPSDALYAGIIRATTGDREDAKRLFDIASGGDLLPEEQRLLSQNRSKVQ
jgi:tetratricopeptide (TPR) repeat protein